MATIQTAADWQKQCGNDHGLHIISSYLSLAKNLSDFGIKSIAH